MITTPCTHDRHRQIRARLRPRRDDNVNGRALGGVHFRCPQALYAKVDGTLVDLVELHGRQRASDLDVEARRVHHLHGGDQVLHDEVDALAVVDDDAVRLAVDHDVDGFAPADQDALVLFGLDDDGRGLPVVVLDGPFVSLEFLPRRLLSAQ